MAHDVFISHSSIDKSVADTICSILEQNKICCWIAPRDVTPGKAYSACITEAIISSKVLIVVFSNNSNTSTPVINELESALRHGVKILPVRIDDIQPSTDMEYYLCSRHWLDAFIQPIEQHIYKLVDIVNNLLYTMESKKSMKVEQDDTERIRLKNMPNNDNTTTNHSSKDNLLRAANEIYLENQNKRRMNGKNVLKRFKALLWVQTILLFVPALIGLFLCWILYIIPYSCDELIINIPILCLSSFSLCLLLWYKIIKKKKKLLFFINYDKYLFILVLIALVLAALLGIYFILEFYVFNTSEAFEGFGDNGTLSFSLLFVLPIEITICIIPLVTIFYLATREKGEYYKINHQILQSQGSKPKDILVVTKKKKQVINCLLSILIIFNILVSTIHINVYNTFRNSSMKFLDYSHCVLQNDWFYYADDTYGNKLYKIRVDGTHKIKLSDDICAYIAVNKDWIYYNNALDDNKLYKIRTDGSLKTKLSENACSNIAILKDWIYYIADNGLYQIKPDGSNDRCLFAFEIYDLRICDDWIYYSSNYEIGRVRTNVTNSTTFETLFENSDEAIKDFCTDGNWIYFSNALDKSNLYKIRLNGTYKMKMQEDSIYDINIVNDWIYYSTFFCKSYKLLKNNTNKTRINSGLY